MPRVARQVTDGVIYHILNRGHCRQEVFHDADDYQNFIDLLATARQRYRIRLFAYCLMPNHYHLLLQPDVAADLSRCLQWVQTSYGRRYHVKYQTSGHLWQGRYKSWSVEKDDYLLTVCRYIEGNPVRARLTTSALGYPWSSHQLQTARENNFDAGRMPSAALDRLPIALPDDWTEFVDTRITAAEKEKVRQRW